MCILRNAFLKIVFLCFLIFFNFQCRPSVQSDGVLVQANSFIITVGDFRDKLREEANMFPDNYFENQSGKFAQKKRLLNEMVEYQLLLLAADQAGVTVPKELLNLELKKYQSRYQKTAFAKELAHAKLTQEKWQQLKEAKLRIRLFLDQKVKTNHLLNNDILKEFYKNNSAAFDRSEKVRVRQIVTDRQEKAEEIQRRLERGENFARLAKELSMAPDRHQGGDVGFVDRKNFPREFLVCFSMQVGDISPIIPSSYGFHFFKVIERQPAQTLSFEDSKEKIRLHIRRNLRQEERSKIVERLYQEEGVTINQELLKRTYL